MYLFQRGNGCAHIMKKSMAPPIRAQSYLARGDRLHRFLKGAKGAIMMENG